MKFGFTTGLLGVLVAVSCGLPSVVFGQQNECADKTLTYPVAIVEEEAIENGSESRATVICKNELNHRCRKMGEPVKLTIDGSTIGVKTLENTRYKVTCNGLCRCID